MDRQLDSNSNLNVNAISCQTKTERLKRVQNLLRLEHLNREETEHVTKLIDRYSDLFQLPDEELSCTNAIKHRIITTDERSVNTKQYRFPPIHKNEIDKQVSNLLNNDIIKTSDSPYNSPLWIVPKKPDSKGNKKWRLVVIDFRRLNEKTLGDAYPISQTSLTNWAAPNILMYLTWRGLRLSPDSNARGRCTKNRFLYALRALRI